MVGLQPTMVGGVGTQGCARFTSFTLCYVVAGLQPAPGEGNLTDGLSFLTDGLSFLGRSQAGKTLGYLGRACRQFEVRFGYVVCLILI